MHRFVLLLIVVGTLQAALVLLARLGAGAGMSILAAAIVSTLGAGMVIGLASLGRSRERRTANAGSLVFLGGAGTVSYAFPNALVFATAEKLGPAHAAMLYAFVPGLTYLIALLADLERSSPRRLTGLLLGFTGATVILSTRFDLATPTESLWLLISLAAPASVAAGNVIRSRFWPQGASVMDIAPGLLLSAGLVLLAVAALAPGQSLAWPTHWGGPLALLATASLFYVLYFNLQQAAGAVYLSQIGYVAAAAGLAFGVTLFDEQVAAPMFAGIALVVLGVVLVTPHPGETGQTAVARGIHS
ncbi:DMT family transporter [Luteimonas arsenica]|uniref:DMT family transporter n=1 Tax=Luteimonas arsenica TaxID=1586242 RepID=UPI001055136C|nr:DMT family transporter [Luteimonas arsenica]